MKGETSQAIFTMLTRKCHSQYKLLNYNAYKLSNEALIIFCIPLMKYYSELIQTILKGFSNILIYTN